MTTSDSFSNYEFEFEAVWVKASFLEDDISYEQEEEQEQGMQITDDDKKEYPIDTVEFLDRKEDGLDFDFDIDIDIDIDIKEDDYDGDTDESFSGHNESDSESDDDDDDIEEDYASLSRFGGALEELDPIYSLRNENEHDESHSSMRDAFHSMVQDDNKHPYSLPKTDSESCDEDNTPQCDTGQLIARHYDPNDVWCGVLDDEADFDFINEILSLSFDQDDRLTEKRFRDAKTAKPRPNAKDCFHYCDQ